MTVSKEFCHTCSKLFDAEVQFRTSGSCCVCPNCSEVQVALSRRCIMVRLPKAMHLAVREAANKTKISINQFCLEAIDKAISNQKR